MQGTLRDQFRGKHPFFWVVVIAAVYATCAFAYAVPLFFKYVGLSSQGYIWDAQLRVTYITPGGPAEGKLQVGDVIWAIDGRATTATALRQEFGFTAMSVGTAYRLEIERKGSRQEVELRLVLHPSPNRAAQLQNTFINCLLSLCFLALAILAGLLRPNDANVRLFFAAFYVLGINILPISSIFHLLNETEKLIWNVNGTLFGAVTFIPILFHLLLRFPPGIPSSRFWEMVKRGFYLATILLHSIFVFEMWGRQIISNSFSFYSLLQIIPLIQILGIVIVVIRNYRLVQEFQQKQRIKWIIFSTAAAFSAAVLWVIVSQVSFRIEGGANSNTEIILRPLYWITILCMLNFPLAWAYAILKHRVLDINVVIRRSLRYLLASRGFILIEALLAFALLSFVFAGRLGAALDRLGSNTRTLVTILGSVLMVLGLQTVNRKIRPLIDRRFFRDAYDAQQLLTELTSSLRATTNVKEVLELTTAKIQQALYAANVTIFLRNGQHDFQSAVSSDYHEREKSSQPVARELHLPDEAFVVQRIHTSSQPAEIDWDDPYSPVATQLAAMANGDAAAQQEFDTLRTLKTNLVLPLAAKDELLGVLALGPRAGDLPYSREDKRMLMNVAGQTAMALENSRLIEQKIEIEAENNRKTQELEEARRLQLSMLPKSNVRLERLEITGAMRTATEVGGDYYDFLPLPDGRYCVVIGDATGHGMSAGLIVGMVKMGLTSRLQTQPNLQPMIEDLNTALKQSLTHRGVGMCLGATIIDPVTLTVELCSNGMPFPYHFTNGSLRAIELKAQPLGFLKHVNVPTASLQLQTGEALIWVSDGFEERMNARNEEWGAEQVALALTEICQHETSGEAIARELIAACDRASDGRNNNDDMTIVVVKVASESA